VPNVFARVRGCLWNSNRATAIPILPHCVPHNSSSALRAAAARILSQLWHAPCRRETLRPKSIAWTGGQSRRCQTARPARMHAWIEVTKGHSVQRDLRSTISFTMHEHSMMCCWREASPRRDIRRRCKPRAPAAWAGAWPASLPAKGSLTSKQGHQRNRQSAGLSQLKPASWRRAKRA
jgi:hypothetical protein